MRSPQPPAYEKAELLAANEHAAEFFRERLLSNAGEKPLDYLASRGFTNVAGPTQWTVGYAPPSWTSLCDHLAGQAFSSDVLIAAGLVSTSRRGSPIDRFRDRLMFGIRDVEGHLVGFTARCAPGIEDSVPKYLNTPSTSIYDKKSSLFGLGEQAPSLRGGANLVLVEGPLDALAVDRANAHGVRGLAPVALCGTAMTQLHGQILAGLVKGHVIVALDGDAAGTRAAETACTVLMANRITSLFASGLRAGSDPAARLQQTGPDGLQRELTQLRPLDSAIVDSRVNDWPNLQHSAEARVACLREVAHVLAQMAPAGMTRQAARLSRMLDLDHATVTRELTNAVTTSAGPRGEPGRAATTRTLAATLTWR